VKAAGCLDFRPSQLLTTDPNLGPPLSDLLDQVPPEQRATVQRILEAFFATERKPPKS
jgi:hypothetical protein